MVGWNQTKVRRRAELLLFIKYVFKVNVLVSDSIRLT